MVYPNKGFTQTLTVAKPSRFILDQSFLDQRNLHSNVSATETRFEVDWTDHRAAGSDLLRPHHSTIKAGKALKEDTTCFVSSPKSFVV